MPAKSGKATVSRASGGKAAGKAAKRLTGKPARKSIKRPAKKPVKKTAVGVTRKTGVGKVRKTRRATIGVAKYGQAGAPWWKAYL